MIYHIFSMRLAWMKFVNLFYHSTYFCYYSWVSFFGIINEFYCTISANFFIYLQYF